MEQTYNDLLNRLRQIGLLRSCSSLLGWDEETYMPKAGTAHRSEQQALLSGLCHDLLTDEALGELLDRVGASELTNDPTGDPAVNVRETRRLRDRAVKVPKKLVEDLARTTTLAVEAWREARKNAHFPTFQPWLEKVVDLRRRQAECIGYEKLAYDALIDEFEPGQTTDSLEGILKPLGTELAELVKELAEAPRQPNREILTREFPVDAQRELSLSAAGAIGFDFTAGRLDVSTHPFSTSIGPGDARITTRYDAHCFSDAFMGTLHEAGHGMYEQGLPAEHFGTPRGEAVSYGIHESQSRMWENFVGRSRPFWEHFFPQAQKHFPVALGDLSLDDFYFALNDVQPSFIRVEADEATYNLHILVRFELEQAMIGGDLPVADVPGAWNETFDRYLGLAPPDDAQGCLQDIHWSGAMFGYFPSYSLGNLYAAQFFAQARADLGDLDTQFARGEFAPLLGWLREQIHSQGQRYRAAELVETVTGEPLSYRPLVEHLRGKYAPLYGL
jgi:carboxypeptidase Taq